MKRSHLGMVLSMFAVFGSGIVVGALGYHSYTVKTVAATASTQQQRRSPDEWRRNYVQELSTRLQLEPTQVSSLNSILDETRTRFQSLKQRQKQEADQQRSQIRTEQIDKVRAMLKPTQLAEYDKFREERDLRMKKEQAEREQKEKNKAAKAGN